MVVTSFPATVEHAMDGDTLKLQVDFTAAPILEVIGRLSGLNAPEMGTLDNPNMDGWFAKAALLQWFEDRKELTMTAEFHGRDKYGRSLVRIIAQNGDCLNDYLLASGFAVPYP